MKVTAISIFTLLSAIGSARVFRPSRNFVTRQATNNVYAFEGNVGAPAPAVKESGNTDRPFEVDGATFHRLEDAAMRCCDIQLKACVNEANIDSEDIEFADCNVQKEDCLASAKETAGNESNPGEDETNSFTGVTSNSTMPATNNTAAVNVTHDMGRSFKERVLDPTSSYDDKDDGNVAKLSPLRARIDQLSDTAQGKRRRRLIRRSL